MRRGYTGKVIPPTEIRAPLYLGRETEREAREYPSDFLVPVFLVKNTRRKRVCITVGEGRVCNNWAEGLAVHRTGRFHLRTVANESQGA